MSTTVEGLHHCHHLQTSLYCHHNLAQDGLKLEESGHQGFYFRLTLKEGGGVSKSKNFTIMETNKGGVKFRNSLLSRINEEQMDVKRKYEEVQRSVVKEIMELIKLIMQYEREGNLYIADMEVSSFHRQGQHA